MKTLDTDQEPLIRSSSVSLLDLVVITVYTDRVAKTGPTSYYFAPSTFYYDWLNSGTTREFAPFLMGIDRSDDAMSHLPTDARALRRTRQIRLRNGPYPEFDDQKLWKTLRGVNLVFADVTIASIALGGTDQARWNDGTGFAGDEHTVFYRGSVSRVSGVSEDEITLELESELPQVPWVLLSDPLTNDPIDLGKRLPVIYGQAKKVPGVGWDVGWVTTMAEEITATQTTVELTDASGLGTSGTARIGTEEVTWSSGPTLNALTIVRAAGGTNGAIHKAGEAFVEVPSAGVTFAFAGHVVDAINDVYVLSPFNGELFRIDETGITAFTKTLTPHARTTFTAAQMKSLLDAMSASAEVTAQPVVTHAVEASRPNDRPTGGTIDSAGRDGVFANAVWISSDLIAPTWPVGATPIQGNCNATFQPHGVVVTQTLHFHVKATSAEGSPASANTLRLRNSGSTKLTIASNAGAGEYLATSTADNNTWTFEIDFLDTDDAAWQVWDCWREVVYEAAAPTVSTPVAIIGAAVGFGLRLYADVDGPVVPTLGLGGSLKIAVDNGGGNARRALIGGPLDVSAGKVLVWIYIPTSSGISLSATDGVRISLHRTTTSNFDRWNFGTDDGLAVDDAWHEIEFTPSVDASDFTGGTGILLTDVKELTIAGGHVAPTGAGQLLYVDDIRLLEGAGPWGSMSLHSDGVDAAIAERVFPSAPLDFSSDTFSFWYRLPVSYTTSATVLIRVRFTETADANLAWWDFGTGDGIVRDGAWHEKSFTPSSLTPDFDSGIDFTDIDNFTMSSDLVLPRSGEKWYIDDVKKGASVILAMTNDATNWTPNADVTLTDEASIVFDGNTHTMETDATNWTDQGGIESFTDEYSVTIEHPEGGPGYTDTLGSLIQAPEDIVRHFIAERCAVGNLSIHGTSFAAAGTNLGANVHAPILNALGDNFAQILQRLGVEMRANIIQADTATGTVYKMFAAESDFDWPVTARTLTLWGDVSQEGRDPELVKTRWLAYYGWNPALGTGVEAYTAVVRIDLDQNDVAVPSVANLTAAEASLGRRDAEPIFLPSVQGLATAEDVLAYYAHEGIRQADVLSVGGVPFPESYDLERGDVVDLVNPVTGDTLKGRVMSVERDPISFAATIGLVEVE